MVGLLAALLVLLVQAAAQTTPADCKQDRPGFLTCHLTSINSRLERTDFSVIPAGTVGLAVECSQSSLGSLQPAAFRSLPRLQELAITGCALASLPSHTFSGLDRLQRLVVRTGTRLSLQPGALAGLPALLSLDLSNNVLESLPAGELCGLPSLASLNLSTNALGSLARLGADTPDCLAKLSALQLDRNQLTGLDTALPAPALTSLSLSHNFIRFLAPSVMSNSPGLEELDLSNNQVAHLPAGLLSPTTRLARLNLANNSLSALATDSLAGPALSLATLDLAGNLLTGPALQPGLAATLPRLTSLDLSANLLESVEPALLASLPGLTSLRLADNRITSLSLPAALAGLLELDLAGNRLAGLEATALTGLPALTRLSLARNSLSSIHPATFRNTSAVLVLDLSSNQLTAVPDSLKYLTNLQTLDLGENGISSISGEPGLPGVFTGMTGLWRLQLHGNSISNISHAVFSTLATLQILDVSRNNIEHIDRGAFDQNQQLRAVRLDGNRVSEIDGVFTHLPDLIWLNVSDNKIRNFDYALVPRTLHWLDISHNQVEEIGNYFDLSGDLALSYLNAGFNSIRALAPLSLPDSLETLLLNDNAIASVAPYTFFKKAKLVTVDLTVNEISGLAQPALRLSPDLPATPEFLLGGNPILCNCEMQWFQSVNDNNSIQRYPVIADLESIYCRLVYTTEQAFIPLVEARADQFLCQYQTHCFSLCQCCQFDSCDCEMTCPDGCSCYHDNSWSKNIIQCSSGQFTDLPASLPMDATEIFLDGNALDRLHSHTFIGRKNLRVLHLNHSRVTEIENQTFNGLKSLTALHLEGNSLSRLQGWEFSRLSHLRELHLQDNTITTIATNTFAGLKSLELLNLAGNLLVDWPVWELASNPYLVSVRLAENLWSCDCGYLAQFRDWLKAFSVKVSDVAEVSCVSNEAAGSDLALLEPGCEEMTVPSAVATSQVQDRTRLADYTPLMVATLASFAFLLLISLTAFACRDNIRVWLHSRYGLRVFESLECKAEAGKLFDAFVSYSPGDELFVRQVVAAELEQAGRYRVCLHHRDLPSNTLQSDTVVRASEAAQRTIVILSQNFIKTEWSRFDYKSGLLQAVNNGSKKVIFVLLGNLESAQLDPNLRLLLKNNLALQWGDSHFWSKLRYLLPDLTRQDAEPQPAGPASGYSSYRPQLAGKQLHGQVNVAMHM